MRVAARAITGRRGKSFSPTHLPSLGVGGDATNAVSAGLGPRKPAGEQIGEEGTEHGMPANFKLQELCQVAGVAGARLDGRGASEPRLTGFGELVP